MKKYLLVLLMVGTAHASEYGCKVLLCLANPASNGGPQGVAECVAPIDQLYHDLSKGRPFPTCDSDDGNDGSSYARQINDPYDPCPALLQSAVPGSYVVQGRKKTGQPEWGNGFDLMGQPQVSEGMGSRACVGKRVGSYEAGTYENTYIVNVFDKVVWQPAQNPQAIDVFIDKTWQQRVRY